MKVFAGFIRKYYQGFFSFISKNICPLLAAASEVDYLNNDSMVLKPIQQKYDYYDKKNDDFDYVTTYFQYFFICKKIRTIKSRKKLD